jgi:hypothetical protein
VTGAYADASKGERLARHCALLCHATGPDQATLLIPATDQAIRRALERAGIEFIDENGGGVGVRFKKPI